MISVLSRFKVDVKNRKDDIVLYLGIHSISLYCVRAVNIKNLKGDSIRCLDDYIITKPIDKLEESLEEIARIHKVLFEKVPSGIISVEVLFNVPLDEVAYCSVLIKIKYDKARDNVIFKVLPFPYAVKRLPQAIYVLDNMSEFLHRRHVRNILKGCITAEELIDL